MTVTFFRLEIRGSSLTKLESIRDWLETKIENNDLHSRIGDGRVRILTPEELVSEVVTPPQEYVLLLKMYIKPSVNVSKYRDIIKTHFQSLNKTGLISGRIVKYDNCSHDSDNPQPCVLTEVMRWDV